MGQWALELVGQRFELGCNSRSSVERQKALTALREALSPRVEKLGAPWDRRRKLMSSLSSSFSFEPATTRISSEYFFGAIVTPLLMFHACRRQRMMAFVGGGLKPNGLMRRVKEVRGAVSAGLRRASSRMSSGIASEKKRSRGMEE
ncbi:hypothetical protein CDL15_Pgr023532 [Punica granatum]|uniref:Uncharacterized protein n=1 Tax=Punica granatum TaxID=22663 RepID=A0A218W6R7_PUNGR|nr:hypothetical protein CDL15_Pgr023532 [Punica granatum]